MKTYFANWNEFPVNNFNKIEPCLLHMFCHWITFLLASCFPCLKHPCTFFQLVDLQRKEGDLKHLMDDAIVLAQKVVDGKINKQSYVETDEANAAKREKLSQEIESIQESL